MHFLTRAECADWCEGLQLPLDDQRLPVARSSYPHGLRSGFPPTFGQLLWFSRLIESALQPRDACLLWVTDWNIWKSSENLHLYYKLRQSYGDFRLLHKVPGHLCLNYESSDAVTFIYLCILFGWDVHLLPSGGYSRGFISHDEWIELEFSNSSQYEETREALRGAKIKIIGE